MSYFPASFTKGARLLGRLRMLKPGECFRMDVRAELSDIEVPANPLDRQTPEFLARWMHARMPFYCTLHRDALGNWWEIRRPFTPAASESGQPAPAPARDTD